MKPVIGVVGRLDTLLSGREVYYINNEIREAIIKSDGIVIGIIPNIDSGNFSKDALKELLKIVDMCDGIIVPGGDEIYNYDLEIIEYCYKIDKPLLGICQGMQTMSYLFGGSIEKIGNNSHLSKENYVHKVNIEPNSKLYNIIKEYKINVNSRHKMKVMNTGLSIVGLSDDGIVEAVEDPLKKFFIGVEWHPESMIEYDILEQKLFSYFIDCCRR